MSLDEKSAGNADARPDRGLHGQNVLITRPQAQAQDLAQLLTNRGAQPLLHPVIEILPPDDWACVDRHLQRLEQFHWIVFVSVNGVKFFLERAQELKIDFQNDIREGNLSIAAIGDRTATELRSAGITVDLVPESSKSSDSAGMADILLDHVQPDQSVLLVRANRGSEEIPARLASANISFEQIAIYQSADATTVDPQIMTLLKDGEIDWVTITSSAIARSTVNLFGELLSDAKLVSISPTTSQQLVELGYPPAAEATDYNMQGVVNAMIKWIQSR